MVFPVILPKSVFFPVSSSARSRVKKNCEVFVCRFPLFAIPSRPRLVALVVSSDKKRQGEVPIKLQSPMSFVLKRLPIKAVSTGPCTGRIACLDNEAGYDSVEDDAIVITCTYMRGDGNGFK